MKTIVEKNRMIAEFMGIEHTLNDSKTKVTIIQVAMDLYRVIQTILLNGYMNGRSILIR